MHWMLRRMDGSMERILALGGQFALVSRADTLGGGGGRESRWIILVRMTCESKSAHYCAPQVSTEPLILLVLQSWEF